MHPQAALSQRAPRTGVGTLPTQAPAETPPAQQVEPSPQSQANTQADMAESLVGLMQGRNEVQASARVVETADEVLGTLIDTRV